MSRKHQVEKLLTLLPPLQDSYVLSGDPDADGTDGKVEVSYRVVREQVTYELLEAHLNGKTRIAVCPILSDGHSSQFGVIDIDVYNIKLDALQKVLTYSLPPAVAAALHPYQTKSGGWHLFLSLTAMVEAGDLKKLLSKLRSWLPWDNDKIDIRPEQAKLNIKGGDRGSMGSYITLPLYNTSMQEADQWLAEFEAKRVAPETLVGGMNEGIFEEGPPCLFPLAVEGKMSGEWHNRDFFVLQLSIFLQKKHPADWQERVRNYARENIYPQLNERQVDKTISSVERSNPRYICTRGSFPRVCNKGLCMARKHGVASGDSAENLIKGHLAVIDADPKVWFLTIVGRGGEDARMQLSTSQLQNVQQFRKRCLEEMKHIPDLPKQNDWEQYINKLLEEVTVIPVPDSMTPEAELMNHIREFYLSSSTSNNAEDLLRGRIYVYTDTKDGKAFSHMVFNLLDLKTSMVRGRHLSPTENLYTKMRQLEMSKHAELQTVVYPMSGTEINVWDMKLPDEWINQKTLTNKGLKHE